MNQVIDYDQMERLTEIIDFKLNDLPDNLFNFDYLLYYPDKHKTHLSESELKRLTDAIEKNFNNDNGESFRELLSFYMSEKNMKAHTLYDAASVEKSYFYKILTGRISPTRDVCIRICLALKLEFEESKGLLRTLGYSFYEKSRRDIIITECIRHKTGLYIAELLLDRYGEISLCNTSILLRS